MPIAPSRGTKLVLGMAHGLKFYELPTSLSRTR
jgi:hypothetical protein